MMRHSYLSNIQWSFEIYFLISEKAILSLYFQMTVQKLSLRIKINWRTVSFSTDSIAICGFSANVAAEKHATKQVLSNFTPEVSIDCV